MNAKASAADSDIITKGEFAERRGVSRARVSQWIKEKKIPPSAIVGEGRGAKIRERLACESLRKKLDPMQLAGNGLGTRLDVLPAKPSATLAPGAEPNSAAPADDQIEDRIKSERLAALQRTNRREAEDEAQRAGRLTDAAAAANEMRRVAGQMLTVFEGSLPELASAIAAKWKLPQRDVLHLLRAEFIKVRAQASATFRKTAESIPRLAGLDIEDANGASGG